MFCQRVSRRHLAWRRNRPRDDRRAHRRAICGPDAQRWRAMARRVRRRRAAYFCAARLRRCRRSRARASLAAWRARRSRVSIRPASCSPRRAISSTRISNRQKLKAMMAAWGMHLDFAPDVAGGALFPYLESMAEPEIRHGHRQGRRRSFITAMVRALEAAGGEVRLGSEAVRIDCDGGGASAVDSPTGNVSRKRAVIANLNPRVLFGRLLAPPTSPRTRSDGAASPGPGHDDGASCSLRFAGLGRRARAQTLRLCAPRAVFAAMARAYTEALAGMLPAEPVLVVGQPTAIDPAARRRESTFCGSRCGCCRRRSTVTPPAASPPRMGLRQGSLRRPRRSI